MSRIHYRFAVSATVTLKTLLLSLSLSFVFWIFGYKHWSKISNSNRRNLIIDGIFEELNFREDSMMGAHRKWSTSAINLILRSPPPSTLRATSQPGRVKLRSLCTNGVAATARERTRARCVHIGIDDEEEKEDRNGRDGCSGRTNAKSMPRPGWRGVTNKVDYLRTFQARRNQEENFPANGKKLIN